MAKSPILTSVIQQYSEIPFRKGYRLPENLKHQIAKAHRTRLLVTTATALFDHAMAVTAAIISAWGLISAPMYLSVPALVLAVAVSARAMRGMECLVHEASHYNWSRQRRRANDTLALILVGLPTGARISDYRSSHLLHHGRFATIKDPDRQRYVELGLENLDRSSIVTFTAAVLRLLPSYQVGWVKSLRTNGFYLVSPVLWPALIIGFPVWFAVGGSIAITTVCIWLVSLILALPLIRLIAESGEHVYSGSSTVFDATISNLGFWHKTVFHPHNDGFHTLHHMWPGIPHHSLRKVHRLLTKADPSCYGDMVKCRTKVLQQPIRSSDPLQFQ